MISSDFNVFNRVICTNRLLCCVAVIVIVVGSRVTTCRASDQERPVVLCRLSNPYPTAAAVKIALHFAVNDVAKIVQYCPRKGQFLLCYPGRRQVRSWSQTCSKLEFGLSSSSLAAS